MFHFLLMSFRENWELLQVSAIECLQREFSSSADLHAKAVTMKAGCCGLRAEPNKFYEKACVLKCRKNLR